MSILLPRYYTCPECGRVFDMEDTDDAEEWHYGHDCEDRPDDDPTATETPSGT